MTHRIREAMRDDGTSPLGGSGKTVEADETYIGADRHRALPARFRSGKGWILPGSAAGRGLRKVVALVERDGRSRAFPVDHINAKTVRGVLVSTVPRDTALMTDEARLYTHIGKEFASHKSRNT